ncbi:MAG: hypothetical protein HRT89_24115, partial [Lentisphaeria bacterium]|nr:hypothetical protein [Lentisphaeria bacterium]
MKLSKIFVFAFLMMSFQLIAERKEANANKFIGKWLRGNAWVTFSLRIKDGGKGSYFMMLEIPFTWVIKDGILTAKLQDLGPEAKDVLPPGVTLRCKLLGDEKLEVEMIIPKSKKKRKNVDIFKRVKVTAQMLASERKQDKILAALPQLKKDNPQVKNWEFNPMLGKGGTLSLWDRKLNDISALKGLPLLAFGLSGTKVTDLGPLKGMKLEKLFLRKTLISDLSSLKGMPLKQLTLNSSPVSDLSALKGMPLEFLELQGTKVKDLSALKGMPLWHLNLENTNVSDLSPLKGLSLRILNLKGTKVVDFSVLRKLPLTRVTLPQQVYGIEFLRSMKNLSIGNHTQNFWINYDYQVKYKKEFNQLKKDNPKADFSDLFSVLMKSVNLGVGVTNFKAIKNVPMRTLSLHNSNVTDFSVLKNM